jgi:hypothetical protein
VHCRIEFLLTGNDTIVFELTPGLQILEPMDAPIPGDANRHMKIIRVGWERESDRYALELEGRSGSTYALEVRLPRKLDKIDGARWDGLETNGVLTIEFPAVSQAYARRTVTLVMAKK